MQSHPEATSPRLTAPRAVPLGAVPASFLSKVALIGLYLVVFYLLDAYRIAIVGYPQVQYGLNVTVYDTVSKYLMAVPALVGWALVASAFVLQTRLRRIFVPRVEWAYVLLFVYCLASVAWSQSIGRSVTDIGMVLLVVSAAYMAVRLLGEAEIIRHFLGAITICVLLSIVSQFAIPEAYDYRGNFRGIFVDKNALGNVSAMGLIVAIHVGFSSRRTLVSYVPIFACLWTLVESGSATAIVASVFGLTYYLICHLMWRFQVQPSRAILLQVGIACILIAVVIPMIPLILEWLGRDPTASSRTRIWTLNLQVLNESGRLLFGAGLNAFWAPGSATHAAMNARFIGLDQSHNGYVELLSELGIVGFAIFMVPMGAILFRTIVRAFAEKSAHGIVFAVIIVLILLQNAAESMITKINHYHFFMLSLIALSLAHARKTRGHSPD